MHNQLSPVTKCVCVYVYLHVCTFVFISMNETEKKRRGRKKRGKKREVYLFVPVGDRLMISLDCSALQKAPGSTFKEPS